MRTREAAIYYDYLAEIMEELLDKIDDIRSDMRETQDLQGFEDTYLNNKLRAYMSLYTQLDDLCYKGWQEVIKQSDESLKIKTKPAKSRSLLKIKEV